MKTKVLWFSNLPCGAAAKLTGKRTEFGGWLVSLEEQLKQQPDIELHVAFYWQRSLSSFEYEGVVYHPMKRACSATKLQRYLSRLQRQWTLRDDEAEVRQCVEVVREVKPDLIHVHGSEGNFGLLAESVRDIPIVLSIQGILTPYYTQYFSGYPRREALRHDTFCHRLLMDGIAASARRFLLNAKREQRIFKAVQHYMGRTTWDRNCSLALNPKRHYYVCNEILRKPFYQARWEPRTTSPSPLQLVTTTSGGLYKGAETLILTAEKLKEAGLDFEWHVIGLSSADPLIRLTRKIYGVNAVALPIIFHGCLQPPDMLPLLSRADIYVQVSHIENSPNSLCEAMLLGMPCVASFAGGTSDMLCDGQEGILVQDGDVAAYAGAVMYMAQERSTAARMGARARERALARHDPQHVLCELLAAYAQVQS